MSVRHLEDFVASLCMAAVIAAAILPLEMGAAQAQLVRAQDAASLLGAERAQGVVIWSHGRSLVQESSQDPTAEYIDALRAAGWDTFRLNRPSITDTLTASAAALADEAEALKRSGYRRVVLAGQSFGAFISLIAAGHSDAVDTVIGTAPAAYGSAQSNPIGYTLNATRLYDLLGAVRRAHVALFFFKRDIFDPGGRGPIADQILAAHGLAHLVVDRPAGLRTHWAGAGAGIQRAIRALPRRVRSRRRGARYSRLPQPGSRGLSGPTRRPLKLPSSAPEFQAMERFLSGI